MTLALLLTAVTGAWADETPIATILASENSTFVSGSKTFADKVKITFSGAVDLVNNRWQVVYDSTNGNEGTVTVEGVNGTNISKVVFYDEYGSHVMTTSPYTMYFYQAPEKSDFNVCTGANGVGVTDLSMITKIEVFGAAEPPIKVEPGEAANTWTFEMPGSDVVLTPLYAPAAKWDVVENLEQLPAALEGIIAGQDAAIVTAGQSAQGTVMYAVTTSAEAAPELSAFSATVPTAKDYDDATTLYVWYYIQGQDTPDGQEATEENTFNDTEICAEPLKVTVLTNKFDIQLSAANANTIEAGKATVTVDGAAATITDGKLQGVKMGSEVKLEAKPGYKFRKVEVKKKGAPKYADVVTICEKNGDNRYLISSFFDGTKANITTITEEEAIALAEYLGGGDIRVVYEEYEFYGDKYGRATNAAGNVTGLTLSTTNTCNVPLYYVPAGN